MIDKTTANFMRSLCLGEILEEIIVPFPQMKPEESEVLRGVYQTLEQWLGNRDKDFREWDAKGDLPADVIEEIKRVGLFSLVVPEEYGGLGLSTTAYSRTIQQLGTYDGSLAVTVGAHSSIGFRGLLLFGTADQKTKYLPRLATGEMIAAFCLTEPGAGSDAAAIKTKAVKDGADWILNGEKLWITNGGIADFFTVFARTEGTEGQMTAFLVTRDMKGVSTGPKEDKMGIRASSTTTVVLENVRVPADHVLGEPGKGFKIAMRILNAGRTGLGGGCVGGMKKAIELATKQAKQRNQFGKPIAEFGLVKQKIGHMVVECYATESLVGMVSGIIDRGYSDYAVEAAISKVFASECYWRTIDEALQIAGGNGFMREFPYERMLRDARINRIFEGTNEILRLFIALTAMNDVGKQLKEVASSLGNVLQDPIKGFGVFSDYAKRRVAHATGFGQDTFTNLHPSLKTHAAVFEDATRKLGGAADRILRKHGKKIVEKQFATRRLGDILIDLFALACVLSRVSQSIEKNGEKAAEKEIEILTVFSRQAAGRINRNIGKIDDNDDESIKSLADHALAEEKFSWDTL